VIPEGLHLELPLASFHWLVGSGRSVFPHTLIIAGANSRVTVIDFLRSAADQPGFACSVNDLIVGPGAQVAYTCLQEWSEQVLSFQINATEVDRDGHGKSLNVHLGGAYARAESQGRLIGAGARSEMLSVSVGHATQNFDQRTLQYHQGPHTWSDLLYKNALSHRSRSVFKGLIQVAPTAQFTDAYQTNRNLLLDPEAEADSMPGLEILNDDVKCSHGATTGPVDREELFYLLARGIPPVQAKQLIVEGFLAEVTDRLGHEALAHLIAQRIHAKFERTRALGHLPTATDGSTTLDPTDPSLALA
ncbi:MAG: Fe-S cluster assembly protein SufD, partial [Verrucomicrobiia bacterium]